MTRFERWAVWSTSIATVLTGLVYLWMKYLLVNDDPFAVVNHPLQPLVLKVHIVVAPLLTFAIGLVALRHIWRHVSTGVRRGRRTGLTMVVAVAPMILTGYLIQAITQEGLLTAMAYSHIGLGIVYAVGLLAHHFAAGGAGRHSMRSSGGHGEVVTSPASAPSLRSG
jgi:hypothetical protein